MTFRESRSGYRPEIDGLRAVAIVPVVLFHYRAPGFGGGFVGVDVFFVISGYLITRLIWSEMERGTFSLARFYERRVRRIFPALFAMLAVVSAAALVFFFPVDLVRYARSLVATALFAANFEFWHEAGYFDVLANQKPLLHLWSIAVEEQFYLLYPALLLVLRGVSRRQRLAAIAGIFLASLVLSTWGAGSARIAAFYLLPTRSWELMLGALIGLGALPNPKSAVVSDLLASLGLILIAGSVLAFTPETSFPGWLALVPTLGAALVIHGANPESTLTGKVLSARPLVWIGLISYSLYLWHWPVFVFATYVGFTEPSGIGSVTLISLSVVLAAISWRFVEQPLRRPLRSSSRRTAFAAAALVAGLTAASGALATSSDGLPQRMSPALQRILAEQEDHEPRIARCFGLKSDDVRKGRLCRIGASLAKTPSFILWGDSHADAILPAVADAAAQVGRVGLFAGGEACPPLLGVTTPMPDCRPFNDAVMALAARAEIKEVILEARWAKYAEGSTYGSEPNGRIVLADSVRGSADAPDNHEVFFRGIERTVNELRRQGKQVVIVAAIPEIGWPVPAVLARRALAEDTSAIEPSLGAYVDRQRFVLATFDFLQKNLGTAVLYPHKILCASGTCNVAVNGVPLYRDEHHLSVRGARQLVPLIEQAFQP
ncbi:MAG TPA: acyltransferase family protein [Rhizomicrobium sp.]